MKFEPALDHLKIAGVLDRHGPDLGEIYIDYLFTLLDTLS